MRIPQLILRQLYNFGSLENTDGGIRFELKNRLSDVELLGVSHVKVNKALVGTDKLRLDFGDGETLAATAITESSPISFPLRKIVGIQVDHDALPKGKHKIEFGFSTRGYGKMKVAVEDAIQDTRKKRTTVPIDRDDNYSASAIAARQEFVKAFAGVELKHTAHYSIDPPITEGNCENFTGVAQVPLGFAGPIHVRGEHTNGEFLVPLATSEGTLVASYNRGIKVVNLSGGVRCTVQDDCMQRAPVFIFDNAQDARDFRQWVVDHMDTIREKAEETSSIAKLLYIDPYLANKFCYLRFNFSTGDAAGQNMVGRATFAACSWILEQEDARIRRFYLESNLATDKKASQVNIMHTRGKRVTAEIVVPRTVLNQVMRVEPESLVYHQHVANVGAFLSGANNNGAHSPNAITAIFIATGQDVANVSESSAGITYTELTPEGDLYFSLTIPSLIVATYGGGTGLPTQRECLEAMGCYGRDKAKKLAEIVAGVCLAGELSLASAISSFDWVSSHEKYGRNR